MAAPGQPRLRGAVDRGNKPGVVKAEEELIKVLRDIDAQLKAGLSSPEIAAREKRKDGVVLMSQVEIELPPGPRPMIVAIFLRRGLKHWPKPRSRKGALIVELPSVVAEEVFLPQFARFQSAYNWFIEDSGEEIAGRAFWSRESYGIAAD